LTALDLIQAPSLSELGRLFHVAAEQSKQTNNERLPYVISRYPGKSSWPRRAEQRCWRPGTTANGW